MIQNTKPSPEPQPHTESAELDRIADSYLADYDFTQKRIPPLVGLLRYLQLAAVNPSLPDSDMACAVCHINRRILAALSDEAFSSFEDKLLDHLHRVGPRETVVGGAF